MFGGRTRWTWVSRSKHNNGFVHAQVTRFKPLLRWGGRCSGGEHSQAHQRMLVTTWRAIFFVTSQNSEASSGSRCMLWDSCFLGWM